MALGALVGGIVRSVAPKLVQSAAPAARSALPSAPAFEAAAAKGITGAGARKFGGRALQYAGAHALVTGVTGGGGAGAPGDPAAVDPGAVYGQADDAYSAMIQPAQFNVQPPTY